MDARKILRSGATAPDPPSRSEKRDLERREERGVEDAMEAAEIRPYEGSGREEGLERRVRSAAYKRNGKRRSYGHTRVDYQPDP